MKELVEAAQMTKGLHRLASKELGIYCIMQSQLKELVKISYIEDIDAVRAKLVKIKSNQEFISEKLDQFDADKSNM